jgi:hypothetical protein
MSMPRDFGGDANVSPSGCKAEQKVDDAVFASVQSVLLFRSPQLLYPLFLWFVPVVWIRSLFVAVLVCCSASDFSAKKLQSAPLPRRNSYPRIAVLSRRRRVLLFIFSNCRSILGIPSRDDVEGWRCESRRIWGNLEF